MAQTTSMSVDEIVQAVDAVALSDQAGSFICDDVVILKRSQYDRMTARLAATVDTTPATALPALSLSAAA